MTVHPEKLSGRGARALGLPQPGPPTKGDFRLIGRLGRDYVRHQWSLLGIAVLCMIVTASTSGALAWLLDPAIKKIFLEKDARMLVLIPIALVGVVALRAVSQFGEQSIINSIAERIVAAVQRDMFRSQIRLDLAALNAEHSGEMVSKFLYDATLLRGSITRGVAGLGKEFITLIALAAVMLYQDWKLALISVLVLPLIALVTRIISKSLRKASTRGMQQTGILSRALSEALAGRRVIKAYNLEDHAVEIADHRIAQRLKYLLRAVRARSAAVPATDLIGGIAAAATFFYAGYQGLHGELAINQFASFVAAMLLAQQPVRNLTQLWTISTEGLAAANRIFALIDSRPAIVDAPGVQPLKVSPPPRSGAVRFDNVRFAYQDGSTALDGVTLDIPPGKKVALVGPSGAGKTTVFNLLLRFFDLDSGTIAVDGQDIRTVTLQSLRDAMALVTQEPIVFDETVADNIALGRRGASRAEIVAAAKAAAADGFINEIAGGYDAAVGEGGLKLSGGQRQRIAIARAMLRNAPILLLDEATSSLDTESERQVQQALATLMKGRTTIVIAHRLSTVLDADRIYVLDRGRVVEAGTHAELIAKNGLYTRLYQHNLHEEPAPVAAAD
jgi:ATP-binding cassette, subfamily B, bacterial MsbA